jgi:hypothetical protein
MYSQKITANKIYLYNGSPVTQQLSVGHAPS